MDCVLRKTLCLSPNNQAAEVGAITVFLKVVDKIEESLVVLWNRYLIDMPVASACFRQQQCISLLVYYKFILLSMPVE